MLITVMSERELHVPRFGRVVAAPGFRLVAAMNPFDAVGTARISSAVYDRMCRLRSTTRARPTRRRHRRRAAVDARRRRPGSSKIVELVRRTRDHPDLRVGSSVRGAIDATAVVDLARGESASARCRRHRSASTPRSSPCPAACGSARAARARAEEIITELWATCSASPGADGDDGDGAREKPRPDWGRRLRAEGAPRPGEAARGHRRRPPHDDVAPRAGPPRRLRPGVAGGRRARRGGVRRADARRPRRGDGAARRPDRGRPTRGSASWPGDSPAASCSTSPVAARPGRAASGSIVDRGRTGPTPATSTSTPASTRSSRRRAARRASTPSDCGCVGWVRPGTAAVPARRPQRVDGWPAAGDQRRRRRGGGLPRPRRLQRARRSPRTSSSSRRRTPTSRSRRSSTTCSPCAATARRTSPRRCGQPACSSPDPPPGARSRCCCRTAERRSPATSSSRRRRSTSWSSSLRTATPTPPSELAGRPSGATITTVTGPSAAAAALQPTLGARAGIAVSRSTSAWRDDAEDVLLGAGRRRVDASPAWHRGRRGRCVASGSAVVATPAASSAVEHLLGRIGERRLAAEDRQDRLHVVALDAAAQDGVAADRPVAPPRSGTWGWRPGRRRAARRRTPAAWPATARRR